MPVGRSKTLPAYCSTGEGAENAGNAWEVMQFESVPRGLLIVNVKPSDLRNAQRWILRKLSHEVACKGSIFP
jgi:hypothetical protein